MMLKKMPAQIDEAGWANTKASFLIEPKPGHSDREVVDHLVHAGADEVVVLGGGFVSARVPQASIKDVESVAYVHEKAEKQIIHSY